MKCIRQVSIFQLSLAYTPKPLNLHKDSTGSRLADQRLSLSGARNDWTWERFRVPTSQLAHINELIRKKYVRYNTGWCVQFHRKRISCTVLRIRDVKRLQNERNRNPKRILGIVGSSADTPSVSETILYRIDVSVIETTFRVKEALRFEAHGIGVDRRVMRDSPNQRIRLKLVKT